MRISSAAICMSCTGRVETESSAVIPFFSAIILPDMTVSPAWKTASLSTQPNSAGSHRNAKPSTSTLRSITSLYLF